MMQNRLDAILRRAAEKAASAVYEATAEAVRAAIQDVLGDAADSLAEAVKPSDGPTSYQDRVTRSEAAKRLGVTQQRIIRLEAKGLVPVEREGGHAYVRVSDVEAALGA